VTARPVTAISQAPDLLNDAPPALGNGILSLNPEPTSETVRPYWKGYLKLALVSCPIALHAACSSLERIAFRQINKATGNRLRQQLIDEETREPVAPEHKGRGYEIGKGHYLVIEDAELDAIKIESTHTIEIDRLVPRRQIDQRFFDTPYYVTPNEPVGQDAFAVIREALRHKGMVALGRLVLSKRERVIALEPYDRGLLGTTLRYPYEVRDAADYFAELRAIDVAPDSSGSPSTFSKARPAISIPQPSATATRRRWSPTSKRRRPAQSPSKSQTPRLHAG
jgi:Ku protein